jgi:hypothetical protein
VRKFPTSDDMEKGVGDYNADIWRLPQRGQQSTDLGGGYVKKCYSVICHQSSTGALWPSWVSILYEWPSYLLWWWFLCSPHLLCYKHTTVHRQFQFITAHTMFLCLNNDKYQWPTKDTMNIQWTQDWLVYADSR